MIFESIQNWQLPLKLISITKKWKWKIDKQLCKFITYTSIIIYMISILLFFQIFSLSQFTNSIIIIWHLGTLFRIQNLYYFCLRLRVLSSMLRFQLWCFWFCLTVYLWSCCYVLLKYWSRHVSVSTLKTKVLSKYKLKS